MFLEINTCLLLFLLLRIFQNVVGETQEEAERHNSLVLGYPLDSLLNFTEKATEHGYVSEEHSVITEDGYILTLFRITKGRNCRSPTRQRPVLLVHGILMTSDSWVDSGPTAGLAYLISDLCYDLWIPNVRGNYYSKQHIKLDPAKDKEYWDFSVLEHGYYDIPAVINYILDRTKSDRINYIGYSQGAGIFLIMNSKRPEYNDKVGVGILLNPTSRLTNMKSESVRAILSTYDVCLPLLYLAGNYEALPVGGTVQRAVAFICKNSFIANTACRFLLSLLDSSNPGSMDAETIRVLFGHYPAGTSAKNMAWYGQGLKTNEFQNFDYGATKNLQFYGTVQPPAFNISLVATPIVVINGKNDFLATPIDVKWATSKLPNVLEQSYVADPLWNHEDTAFSRFTAKYILPKISEYLQKYSTNTT